MNKKTHDTNISFQESKYVLFDTIKKVILFFAIFAVPPLVLRLDVTLFGVFMGEASFTENLQIILLAFTSFMFFRIAFNVKSLRKAGTLVASFFVVLFIRENDSILDKVYQGFWSPLALAVTFFAVFYFMRDYKKGFIQLATLAKMPEMMMLILAMALLLVFSRIFGMGGFWRKVMQSLFVYEVKSIVEEGLELLSYLLIALASFQMNRRILKGC